MEISGETEKEYQGKTASHHQSPSQQKLEGEEELSKREPSSLQITHIKMSMRPSLLTLTHLNTVKHPYS